MSNKLNESMWGDLAGIIKVWLDALYKSGAVAVNRDGTSRLSPDVRNIVTAMHAQLAGGDVKIKINDQGTEVFDDLEQLFDRTWAEMNDIAKRMDSGDGQVAPLYP